MTIDHVEAPVMWPPRLRFTVRWMMVFLLCIGVFLHVAVIAWRAGTERVLHLHTAIVVHEGGIPGIYVEMRKERYWPAFWRLLSGLNWGEEPGHYRSKRLLAEKCELVNPEIRKPGLPNQFTPDLTKDQVTLFLSLSREAGRDVRYENGRFVHRIP